MSHKKRMLNFSSRVTDQEKEHSRTWSGFLRYQLVDGSQLHLGETAEKIFGNRSELNQMRTRGKILSLKKSLEKKKGEFFIVKLGPIVF